MVIEINEDKVRLVLNNSNKELDSVGFRYKRDLDQKLITWLDKILKRNKIDASSIKSYKIAGNLGKESTIHKITEAFVEGLKIEA